MNRHLRILFGMGAIGLLVSCEDSPTPPVALDHTTPVLHSDLGGTDTGTVLPQGPYVPVDLGTLGGGLAQANAINNSGAIVGQMQDTGRVTHAILWVNGVMQDLGGLGGNSSVAVGINEEGDIVGVSTIPDGTPYVVVWKNGAIETLGPRSASFTNAFLNQRGDVAWTAPAPGGAHAFFWRAGVAQDLGTLGGPTSIATGINDAGVVIGSLLNGRAGDAFVWSNGRMQVVPAPDSGFLNTADAINNRGWVSGHIEVNKFITFVEKGWVWDGQSVTLIPILQSTDDSLGVPIAITERGDVFGNDFNQAGDFPHPFLWSHQALTYLNPAKTTQHVLAVNDRGIASGWEPSGFHSEHAIVLDNGNSWNLGVFSGGTDGESQGLNLNIRGDVVGFSTSRGGRHAALWRRVR